MIRFSQYVKEWVYVRNDDDVQIMVVQDKEGNPAEYKSREEAEKKAKEIKGAAIELRGKILVQVLQNPSIRKATGLNNLQEDSRLDDRLRSRLANLVFEPQEKLKKAEYDKIKIFKDGWQRIELPTPPREDREIDAVINAVDNATDQQVKDYKLCDQNASYYIEEHLKKNNLEYDKKVVEYIEEQCVPIVRHYKNYFNRPRPYQVAAVYNKDLKRFKTGTAKTPAYPSGHTVQPLVVAYHYGKKYPQHRDELIRGAKICGYGRVIAGLHYPSDYDAGIELAKQLMKYMEYEKF